VGYQAPAATGYTSYTGATPADPTTASTGLVPPPDIRNARRGGEVAYGNDTSILDIAGSAGQAKQAARVQRDQWKAQMRAQKDYYKTYWRGWHRPSFVGPLILLSFGIIALLMETGKLDAVEFWGWYARWWPLLLIVMGGLLLAEHFLDWNRPWAGDARWRIVWAGNSDGVPRMGFARRASDGAVLVGICGDDNGDNFWNWMGAEHDNDVQIDQALTAAKPSVTINDPQGDITITASTDNQMHLRAHEMVHRDSDSEAQKIFTQLKPRVDASGGGAVITVPENRARAWI